MEASSDQVEEKLIFRADICKALNVSSETVRRWLNAGKIPPPDVYLSRKTIVWKSSTLRAAGLKVF